MENLYNYLGKSILLVDIDGNRWSGIAENIDDGVDNEDGNDSLNLRSEKDDKLYDFSVLDIKTIEILED